MTVKSFSYTTGQSTLPDVGELSYNGCIFSPLFLSNVAGECIADDAARTTKLMQYTITVEGYATHPGGNLDAVPAGGFSMDPTMASLRSLLTAHGGVLKYLGRGNDINVNISGSADVAWGPVPKLIEFQPLGGGLSAKVKWVVKIHIYEKQGGGVNQFGAAAAPGPLLEIKGPVRVGPAAALQRRPDPPAAGKPGGGGGPGKPGDNPLRMLQFNYESATNYGEDGYSTLTNRGVLEIPLTRSPNQSSRTLTKTADFLRGEIERRIMSSIDLRQFAIVRRNFTTSRDKRILTWDFAAEEKGYMDLPLGCMTARGTYSVKPAKAGMGMASWLCSLRATYTVRADRPRRLAWFAFLALLRHRMKYSSYGNLANPAPAGRAAGLVPIVISKALTAVGANNVVELWKTFFKAQEKGVIDTRKAWLMDFNFEEGLYKDSRSTTFTATWRLMTTFSHILLASGLWTKVEGSNRDVWATTIKEVSGAQSWLPNIASVDVIVDLGGG